MKNLVSLLLAAIALASCTPRVMLEPSKIANDRQKLTFQHGQSSITNKQDGLTLTASVGRRVGTNIDLRLQIRNESTSLLSFFPEEITAVGYNKAGQAMPLRVWTAREVVRRQNRNAAIAVGVVAAVAVTTVVLDAKHGGTNNSGHLENHNHFSGGFYDPFWLGLALSPMYVRNYNIPPQVVTSPDGLLRSHTLLEGDDLRGLVRIQGIKGFDEHVEITVPIDGRKEIFVFDAVQKAGKRSKKH
jgi:hypothetical protein